MGKLLLGKDIGTYSSKSVFYRVDGSLISHAFIDSLNMVPHYF